MRKFYRVLVSLLLFFVATGYTKGLTGIKYINPNVIGANYFSSLKQAIDTLNFYGVGANGVVFNVESGLTETAPLGGYEILVSGTQNNPIIFQKYGIGNNPKFYAYTGGSATPTSPNPDGIIKLIGCDYLTLDGMDFLENEQNATNPSTMEFGIGMFKENSNNGCQYNTIKNCNIKLNRINNTKGLFPMLDGSVGILLINATITSANTPLIPTSVAGSNSFNTISSNYIYNTNVGIGIRGFHSAGKSDFCDYKNVIGGLTASSGNTILNFGGGDVLSPAYGILAWSNYDITISNNTIDNNIGNGIDHGNKDLYGIYFFCNTTSNTTINNNKISVKSLATNSIVAAIYLESREPALNKAININNNTIENSTYLNLSGGNFYGIYVFSKSINIYITNNTIKEISIGSEIALGGSFYGIYSWNLASNIFINKNHIFNIYSNTNKGNKFWGILSENAINTTIESDTIDHVYIEETGNSSQFFGISSPVELSSKSKIICKNYVSSIEINSPNNNKNSYCISIVASVTGKYRGLTENYSDNKLSNFFYSGSGTILGLDINTAIGTKHIARNSITNFESNFHLIGIQSSYGSSNIHQNIINNLTTYGLSSVLIGINIIDSKEANIYNNFISNLKTPDADNISESIYAIKCNSTRFEFDITNIFNNTIYLNATSSGSSFSTCLLGFVGNQVSWTDEILLKNNILINKSIPNGSGFASILRNSNVKLSNYNFQSDRNIFYVGDLNKMVFYYDGTNSDHLFSNFKQRVFPREKYSSVENVQFIDVLNNNLHIAAGSSTSAESGADILSIISTDIDSEPRPNKLNSTFGGGTFPDIGADEFDGIPLFPFGDINPPLFTLDSVKTNVNSCANITHTVFAKIYDMSPIDTAQILWQVGDIGTQTPINFVKTTGISYIATIPTFKDTLVNYSFKLVDGSANKNKIVLQGGAYRDNTIITKATSNKSTILIGDTITLKVTAKLVSNVGLKSVVSPKIISEGNPYPSYYRSAKTQYLILASELKNLGYMPGEFKSIGFYASKIATGVGTLKGYTIRISNSTVQNMENGFQDLTFTTVFGPFNYIPTIGLNTHNFSTPFIWDGTSNIIVDICYSNAAAVDQTTVTEVHSMTTNFISTASSFINESTSLICSSIAENFSSIRPVIRFSEEYLPPNTTWTSNLSSGLSSFFGPTVSVTPKVAGNYRYNVTSSLGGCSSNGFVDVSVNNLPFPSPYFYTQNTTVKQGNAINFINTSVIKPTPTWLWVVTPSNGVSFISGTTKNSQQPIIRFSILGKYTIKLTATGMGGATSSYTRTNYIDVVAKKSFPNPPNEYTDYSELSLTDSAFYLSINNDIQSPIFEVYPNPINSNSIIKYNVLEDNSIVSMNLFNSMGAKLKSYVINEEQKYGLYEIEIGDLNDLNVNDIYFLQLIIDGNSRIQKIVLKK